MKVFVTILFSVLSFQALAHNSHCSTKEKIVFSCAVKEKIVSICASHDLSPTVGYMQYRFGKIGAPEILIPQLNEHPLTHVEVDTYQAASGGNGSISFKNGDYFYTVYWESYRSDHVLSNGSSIWLGKSGLIVAHNGKTISDLECNKVSSGDVLEADPYYLHSKVGFPEN